MALNLSVLKTRALTAVVFVVVMLAGMLYARWSFQLLFLIVLAGAAYEYRKLIRAIDSRYDRFPFPFLTYLLAGMAYILLPVLCLFDLYTKSQTYVDGPGWVTPMLIIGSIWINDTMAYLVGSLIGRTPLSSISPKKTWEGTLGGIILAVLLISFGANALWGFDKNTLLAISATAAVFGTLGDLLESKLKRMAGVKDSGSFMPGHGGFLDRFDSLLLAAPAVWLILRLIGL